MADNSAQVAKLFTQYEICDWYEPDTDSCKIINDAAASHKLEIITFHGVWCKDCVYTLPIFKKILLQLNIDKINLIDIDIKQREEKMASKEANEYKLERIPTFILLKDGKEVHRVVEYPNETIEKDFAMALK